MQQLLRSRGYTVIDAKVLAPGLVDKCTSTLETLVLSTRGSIETGSGAAVHGGFTDVKQHAKHQLVTDNGPAVRFQI